MTEFPTSPELESIVSKFRLRVCEIVKGDFINKDDRLFRVDFVAYSDEGIPLVVGGTCVLFGAEDSPRDFARTLRTMADSLDSYWARAFPSTVNSDSNTRGEIR